MIIIFDTNRLNPQIFIKANLSHALEYFFKRCHEAGHEVIIPQTTLLEFTQHQNKARQEEVKTLMKALKVLDSYKVEHSNDAPENFVPTPHNLLDLISGSGVQCKVVEPSEEELREAHKRACLKQCPHPPNMKSDEMRDLVIWMQALRIAKNNGGAVLLSKDAVHTHHRGDKEAALHDLVRIETLEKALEHFEIETPSGFKIKALLETIWDKILGSDLPITSSAQIISVQQKLFTENEDGTSTVRFELELSSGKGEKVVTDVEMNYFGTKPYSLILDNIKVNCMPHTKTSIKLIFEVKTVDITSDLNDRIENLKEMFGD